MVVKIVVNGFVKALVAGTVANGFEKVGFVVLGNDDFETVANGFISAMLAGTIANGFEKVGVVVISDGLFKSATTSSNWRRISSNCRECAQKGWVCGYRRRLSSNWQRLLQIDDSFFKSMMDFFKPWRSELKRCRHLNRRDRELKRRQRAKASRSGAKASPASEVRMDRRRRWSFRRG